jgi:hypothetical protein
MNVLPVEDNVMLGDRVHDHMAAERHLVDWSHSPKQYRSSPKMNTLSFRSAFAR